MIRTTAHMGGVLRLIDRVKRGDRRRVFRDLRTPMRQDIRDHVKGQTDEKRRWPALAASTVERRSRGRKRSRRRLLGRLPTAIKVSHGADFVRAESIVRWAPAHAKGDRVGKNARLPARRWMWMSRELLRKARRAIRKALFDAWRGR